MKTISTSNVSIETHLVDQSVEDVTHKHATHDQAFRRGFDDSTSICGTDGTNDGFLSRHPLLKGQTGLSISHTASTGSSVSCLRRKTFGEMLVEKLRGSATVKMSSSDMIEFLRGEDDK